MKGDHDWLLALMRNNGPPGYIYGVPYVSHHKPSPAGLFAPIYPVRIYESAAYGSAISHRPAAAVSGLDQQPRSVAIGATRRSATDPLQ